MYKIVLDTNTLLYSKNDKSPYFLSSCEAIKSLFLADYNLFINRQILREYSSIATKPYPRGFGLSLNAVLSELLDFEGTYNMLPEPDKIWNDWKKILADKSFSGQILHDAYIAASMHANDIKYILTFNTKDFKKFEGIIPISPENIEILFKE